MEVAWIALNIVVALAVEKVENTEENIVVKVAATEAVEAMAAVDAAVMVDVDAV